MRTITACLFTASALAASGACAETIGGLPVPGGDRIAIVHAEGAQVYECAADRHGTLAWQFREPIATLMQDGKTIGRHSTGPRWEFSDGTSIKATTVAQATPEPFALPYLMLTVTRADGGGLLSFARTVIRFNTKGGLAQGTCSAKGQLLSVPYSADYAFFDAVKDN